MIGRLCLALLCLALLGGAAQAQTSTTDDCLNDDLAIRIPACSKLIAAGDPDKDYLGALYSLRASAYFRMGAYPDAIRDLTEALGLLKAGPDRQNVTRMLATAHFQTGAYDKALAEFTDTLRVPDSVGLNGRGLVYLKMKNYPAAIADYNAALVLKPGIPESLYGRGLAERAQGDPVSAKSDMDQAAGIRPDIAEGFSQAGVGP